MKIIYIMDPLCGWCFGNVDNTEKLYREFKDRVEFEIYPGGLFAGTNTRTQSAQMMNFFLKHDGVISERTGMQFGSAYISFIKTKHNVILDSEIPSRAIVTIKKICPDQTVPFTMELLKARYVYGQDLNLEETYSEILQKLNIDERDFFAQVSANDTKNATQDAFIKAAHYSKTYPTMIIEKDGNLTIIEKGYASYEDMKHMIDQMLT